MSTSVLDMPRLGETMEEGLIVRWLKALGESFVRGETILEIETDKTLAEVPALLNGTLVEIIEPDGRMVTVGAPIARIASAEDAHAVVSAPHPQTAIPSAAPPPRAEASASAPAHRVFGEPVRATPLARRIARDAGFVLSDLTGSGRRGRIEAADVRAALSGMGVAASSAETVAFSEQGGEQLAYVEAGPKDGQPVLLLHGFGADHTAFAILTATLVRRGRRVVVPDLAGHGQTSFIASNPEQLAAGLSGLVRTLGIGRDLHIIAHSLGSAAALALSATNGIALSRLSLIAPAGIGYEIDRQFIAGIANARTPGELSHLLRRLSVREAGLSALALEALAESISRGRLVALAEAIAGPGGQRLDLLPQIRDMAKRLPVRVIVGVEDRIIPWTQVANLPPRVAVHILARSGHMPHWDQPEDVADIVSD